VLNSSGPVSDETRQRIQRIASRLRYSPNGAARSLITRRTHTIGVLLPDLYGEFFSEVIRGIDAVAQQNGYHMLVSSSHAEQDALAAALGAMRGRVDGLIVMSPDLDQRTLRANLAACPAVVLLNCAADAPEFDAIKIDNVGGAAAMTRHLLSLGHRRIAFIKGAARNVDAEERLRGYRAALKGARVERRAAYEIAGEFTEASGHRAAKLLLVATPRPTAIFAANDSMAIGALSALREAGVSVPEEMAVVGFDDIPIAEYTSPPLTSVRVPITELGARATARLVEQLGSKRSRRRRCETLATALVVRQSCGGVPTHDRSKRDRTSRASSSWEDCT
jgi:LacI family transcriptional regulator, galactose operon repressor